MAIAPGLRRAPMAAAARGLLTALGSRTGGPAHPPHHRAASVCPFSSVPASQPSAADAQLLRVINFEISCAQSECRKPNWAKILGEDFPFEIKDKEGTKRITLTRTTKKEQIEVEVLLPSPVHGAAAKDSEQEDQAEDGKKQSHAGNSVQIQYYIPLIVRIRKGAASCLEINCSSYPKELVIESLDFGSSDESGGSLGGAIDFSNLPEELQKALHPYLGIRGISEHFTDFLHAYMINKECHEYLAWLRKLKGLIKS